MTGPAGDAESRSGVSLASMKEYLNKHTAAEDNELREFLVAGVEKVEAHLGRALAVPTTALERLAVKVAAATYWSTQRWRAGQNNAGGGWASGEAIRADSGPSGMAPLDSKLVELLGPAVGSAGDDSGRGPSGRFPKPLPYPDPVVPAGGWSW